ncbi:RrF2 family transcriptional regulator [Roseicitreum antarcticum]|uniref:Transcriptional regulator, BadM/Rrf2 family n=1 Tax=Roseicitreum antarcticum TaxID=564137 RepID=A0A1H2Z4H0_9RHOB|nr:Rrf2 family transcriptional regulator [Roseicitreum antarcticum]SDX11699.1 transcriptional regulator, BadM/Rrf2 family [Roseicitreum antarcticum]
MRLTSYTNYALRTLQMAAIRAPHLVRIDEVAQAHRINRAHLTKVVHQLAQAGYIETVRGPKGGLRLARPGPDIIVGDVVRLTEGPLDLVECFNPEINTCKLRGICKLSVALHKATAAFMAVLDDLTVADIAMNRDDLLARLGLPAVAVATPVAAVSVNTDD